MYKNLAATLVAACCFFPVFSQTPPPASGRIAAQSRLCLCGALTDSGLGAPTRRRPQGRASCAGPPGQNHRYVENVAEGADAERVIRDLAQQGNQLIFTPSFGYMEPTLKVAKDFPHVKFESITGYKTAPNVATANARYYEGRYLAGIAAGRMTRRQCGGLCGGLCHPRGAAGHQCFALGMRSVNPKAAGQSRMAQRLV
jgi:basic membrane protein A